MRIISRKALREFWKLSQYADAEQPLRAWFREASKAHWKNPGAINAAYKNASLIGDNRIVFNIAGNKYRLIVTINYAYEVIYIRFIGTYRQYDKIDARSI